MLNTYHVSVLLHDTPPAADERPEVWLSVVAVVQHNHEDEAADYVRYFFAGHDIYAYVVHVWEVA